MDPSIGQVCSSDCYFQVLNRVRAHVDATCLHRQTRDYFQSLWAWTIAILHIVFSTVQPIFRPPAGFTESQWFLFLVFAALGAVVVLWLGLSLMYIGLAPTWRITCRMAVKLRSWFRRVPNRTVPNQREQQFYAESTRTDSPLYRITAPPCMVVIAEGKGKPEVILGCGWRHGSKLITAYHVLEAKDIGTKLYMYKPGTIIEPVQFVFDETTTKKIGTDCAIVRVKSWPQGVTTATVVRENFESFVSIVGPRGDGSAGQT